MNSWLSYLLEIHLLKIFSTMGFLSLKVKKSYYKHNYGLLLKNASIDSCLLCIYGGLHTFFLFFPTYMFFFFTALSTLYFLSFFIYLVEIIFAHQGMLQTYLYKVGIIAPLKIAFYWFHLIIFLYRLKLLFQTFTKYFWSDPVPFIFFFLIYSVLLRCQSHHVQII